MIREDCIHINTCTCFCDNKCNAEECLFFTDKTVFLSEQDAIHALGDRNGS